MNAQVKIHSGVLLAVIAAVAACSPRTEERQGAPGGISDTIGHGAGHMEGGTPGNADHAFLEKMVNHHEGLIILAGRAQKRGTSSVAADAGKLHSKQHTEQQEMLQMLSGHGGTSVKPNAMPKHRAMSDSLERQTGKEYERGFYRDVIAHHKEGIAMIDSFLPQLSDDSVRTMAENMRSDQAKDIEEFSAKAER